MEDILKRIVEEKRREVAVEKKTVPVERLRESLYYARERVSMARSLAGSRPVGIIAEFKRRSPSKGYIRQGADAARTVAEYAAAGAAACSVLTDRMFFSGGAGDLAAARKATDLPLLRKDFTVDGYQLHQAASWGADAVLLIAAILSPQQCRELACQAHELGLEVLLEVHGPQGLTHLCPEVDMVGVNNRDLRTFRTDIRASLQLAGELPADKVRVSESGIDSPQAVSELKKAGYAGFLIGERFMREDRPGEALQDFLRHVD